MYLVTKQCVHEYMTPSIGAYSLRIWSISSNRSSGGPDSPFPSPATPVFSYLQATQRFPSLIVILLNFAWLMLAKRLSRGSLILRFLKIIRLTANNKVCCNITTMHVRGKCLFTKIQEVINTGNKILTWSVDRVEIQLIHQRSGKQTIKFSQDCLISLQAEYHLRDICGIHVFLSFMETGLRQNSIPYQPPLFS